MSEPDDLRTFLAELPPGACALLKAVTGGGGRGLRMLRPMEDPAEALAQARREVVGAFGSGAVYVELVLAAARHVEVQIAADDYGSVIQLGDRDCSLQRRHQKLVEIAPAPGLDEEVRAHLAEAALRIATRSGYRNLGTVEFLVATEPGADPPFVFLEANARLQVEHAVTEELYDLDLVALQLHLAEGRSLAELGIVDRRPGPGYALEARVNAERVSHAGGVVPATGTLSLLQVPCGPGVRVDTHAAVGYRPDPRFDTLLAKVVVRSREESFLRAVGKLTDALEELQVDGLDTNRALLDLVLRRPEVVAGSVTTSFIDTELIAVTVPAKPIAEGSSDISSHPTIEVKAPTTGTVTLVDVSVGDAVAPGTLLVVVEAMKMEHALTADRAGVVESVHVSEGAVISEGAILAVLGPPGDGVLGPTNASHSGSDAVRTEFSEYLERVELLSDEARADVVARRRASGRRTAREHIADLCDAGSFVEYGRFAIAAQSARRPVHDLIRDTPADGLIAGIGRVNGEHFPDQRASCAVLAYDYTVLAGTQGQRNHQKKDRLFELVRGLRLPVVLFGEGGGGRPGDTDFPVIAGLDTEAFARFAALSGLVPLVGVVEGHSFAGNAALLGCCDVIVATADANIGMAGPAMVEGGGLGRFRPEEIGPVALHARNGSVDLVVSDGAAAVAAAKRYLAYFQGNLSSWSCCDQELLRDVLPERRRRSYDVRRVIDLLVDDGSALELRQEFGPGIVTTLARIEGRPIGIVANNTMHLGGAIDSPGADKAARFLQLCDAFDVPILFLCDTPGFMVGPAAEEQAQVRHLSRMFVTGAALTVPFFTVVLRKGYGLGAQAMAGGSFRSPVFTVSWPTGEFGGMGIEGAVRLGRRRELAAIEDDADRQARFEELVAEEYLRGRALSMATHFEIDDVIDPADTRRRIVSALDTVPPPSYRADRKHGVDPW